MGEESEKRFGKVLSNGSIFVSLRGLSGEDAWMYRFGRSQAWLAGLVLLLGLGGCATHGPKGGFRPTLDQARLAALVEQRLEIAQRVGWIKYGSNLPVKDAKREAVLMDSLVKQGRIVGVPEARVRSFFGAQIEASCEVQAHLIFKWKRGATLPTYPPEDLKRDIRPRLDAISAEMLLLLQKVGPDNPGLQTYTWSLLRKNGFSWRVAGLASYPLN
ncbi:hypothetical protein BH09VER1_BH09VER1_40640 [soil metagenome]